MTTKEYNTAVETYSNRLYYFILKNLRDENDANDVVQDTFMKLWEHKQEVYPEKAKSWLFTTASRALINLAKKNKRTESLEVATYAEPSSPVSRTFELKDVIHECLDTLPPLQRTIILLRDLEGYNYKEIGEILKLNESQVKVYLFRGRLKIKNRIKNLNNVL